MVVVRIVAILLGVMIVPYLIPCLVPAEFADNVDEIQCAGFIKAQYMIQSNGDGVVDISACQNACRMRYGTAPPSGFSVVESPVSEATRESGATIEHSSPALYSQCMEECEREYWGQFEDETKGSSRRR